MIPVYNDEELLEKTLAQGTLNLGINPTYMQPSQATRNSFSLIFMALRGCGHVCNLSPLANGCLVKQEQLSGCTEEAEGDDEGDGQDLPDDTVTR